MFLDVIEPSAKLHQLSVFPVHFQRPRDPLPHSALEGLNTDFGLRSVIIRLALLAKLLLELIQKDQDPNILRQLLNCSLSA